MLQRTLFLCPRARSRRLRPLRSSTPVKGIPTTIFVLMGEDTYLFPTRYCSVRMFPILHRKKESNLILQLADYSAKRAKESVYESMERLNIDHIDLINVHDIEFQASLPGGTFICTGHRRLDIKRKVITIGMTVLHFVPGLPGLCHLLRVVGNLIPTSL